MEEKDPSLKVPRTGGDGTIPVPLKLWHEIIAMEPGKKVGQKLPKLQLHLLSGITEATLDLIAQVDQLNADAPPVESPPPEN